MIPCRVYWGSHGCDLPRGHHLIPGDDQHCRCECAADEEGNVGGYPYYGLGTHFYGEDVETVMAVLENKYSLQIGRAFGAAIRELTSGEPIRFGDSQSDHLLADGSWQRIFRQNGVHYQISIKIDMEPLKESHGDPDHGDRE